MKLKELESVLYKVGAEGFDYCFREYSDFLQIKDKKFHELRRAYENAANELENYLRVQAEKHEAEYEEMLG